VLPGEADGLASPQLVDDGQALVQLPRPDRGRRILADRAELLRPVAEAGAEYHPASRKLVQRGQRTWPRPTAGAGPAAS
jgi:hypothetical protein